MSSTPITIVDTPQPVVVTQAIASTPTRILETARRLAALKTSVSSPTTIFDAGQCHAALKVAVEKANNIHLALAESKAILDKKLAKYTAVLEKSILELEEPLREGREQVLFALPHRIDITRAVIDELYKKHQIETEKYHPAFLEAVKEVKALRTMIARAEIQIHRGGMS